MRYFFYGFSGLMLILFQTAVMPYFSAFDRCYDILIPFVLYLSIFCPVAESVAVIILLGAAADSLSGGPFGLYITSYMWIFIGMKRMVVILHIAERVLMPALVALGVAAENAICFITFRFLQNNDMTFPDDASFTLSVELVWAVATGGFVIEGLRYFHKISDERSWRLAAKAAR